jgi:hypothetical protein
MGKAQKEPGRKRTEKQSSSSLGRKSSPGVRPKSVRAAETSGDGFQVIYIHGIGEQEPPLTLKRNYDEALFGRDVGDRTRMVYWADILHPLDGPDARMFGTAGRVDWEVNAMFDETILSEEASAFAEKLGKKMLDRLPDETDEVSQVAACAEMGGFDAKILPSGSFRRWLTRKITETFIKDVSAYFYDEGVRERVQSRFESLVVPGGGPYVIVSHSLGTVIAYDVLSQLGDDVDVVLFVTLGSPLGIAEVKDHIEKPHKIPAGVNAWKNFADRLDPVALDPGLGNEFKPGNFIADDLIINLHTRRLRGFNPHSSLGYLGHPHVRDAVHALVPPESISRTRRFVIAKDLADEMAGESDRMPVLIEVMDRDKDSVNRARETIIQEIEELTEGASDPGVCRTRTA